MAVCGTAAPSRRGPRKLMSDALPTPLPRARPHLQGSALAPLREPLFRSLWFAAVISYAVFCLKKKGAGWLMTQLTMSPLMISLVQAATTLPVFFVILPARAPSFMWDRRRLLLL